MSQMQRGIEEQLPMHREAKADDPGPIGSFPEFIVLVGEMIGILARDAARAVGRGVRRVRDLGGDAEDDGIEDVDPAIVEALETIHEDAAEAWSEYEAAASAVQAVVDQIDQRVQAMQLITQQFGTQHAARTAASLGREISDLIEQWSELSAEAERLQHEAGAIRARFESVEQQLMKSASVALQRKLIELRLACADLGERKAVSAGDPEQDLHDEAADISMVLERIEAAALEERSLQHGD